MTSQMTLVTSALPYVNNIPHLGNLVGSTLSADVFTRFLRLIGKNVYYLCGSDEYGTTTEVKARKEGLSCSDICTKYHKMHKDVYDWFNIKFDVFGRTSTKIQTETTHEIFFELYRKGHIEEKEIEQMYCAKCDLHLADRYLQGYCYSDKCSGHKIIANGDQCDACGSLLNQFEFKEYWCSTCKEKPAKIKTKHLYIKLNDFSKELEEYFLSDKSKVKMTNNAIGITKALLEKDLESRCITRDLKWGTPVPGNNEFKEYLLKNNIQCNELDFERLPNLDEFNKKVFYVWFDAPIGYLSILKAAEPENWQNILGHDIVQFMAKDNIPFHTIIFPATLLGSNPKKYPLVTAMSCTEYLDYHGQKFSKSQGIGIFGDKVIELSNELNITEDYWRYYLMRIRPETHDASFNWNEFQSIVRSELAYKIGNLINRCMAMTYKYMVPTENGSIITNFDFSKVDTDEDNTFLKINKQVIEYISNFEKFKFRDALLNGVALSEIGNGFIQKNTIWNVCREDPEKGYNLLGCVNYLVCVLIKMESPFMPRKCEDLSKNFIHDVDLLSVIQKGTVRLVNENYNVPFNQMNEDIIKRIIDETTRHSCFLRPHGL